MVTRKAISRVFSVLFIAMFLFMGVLPVQAQASVGPLSVSGDFIWAKGVGGIEDDHSQAITTDSNGNIYVTGYFKDTVDFDPGAGTSNLISAGAGDVFVTKSDSNGNLIWAKSMSGVGQGEGLSVAVDFSGNVYVTGYFWGTADFDPGAGITNLISAGQADIFISKLDNNGSFVWAKSIGGANNDQGFDIALDSNGNVYATGTFQLTVDFDPNGGAINLTSAGGGDIFISKLESNGNFGWAKSMGGTSYDYGWSILVDSNNDVYTMGSFQGTVDFDPNASTSNLSSAGGSDIFVSKLNSSGNFIWAQNMGGPSNDFGSGIAVDSSHNIYMIGYFQGTADFDPGAGTSNLVSAGNFDIFVSKLDSGGNFGWAKGMGGTNDDLGISIAVDSIGNVYTTGDFQNTADFDPNAGTSDLISMGMYDIFTSKLDNSGNLTWAISMGGLASDSGTGITLDSSGNIYTTGYFQDTVDFDPGVGTSNLSSVDRTADIFISKFYNEDNIAPTVASIGRANPSPTSASTVDFTVTFSEPVTGVGAIGPLNDFVHTTSPGITGAFVLSLTPISETTYTVSVNTGLGNGTIRLDVVDNNSIVDDASNPLGGAALSDGDFTNGQIYTIIKSATFADVPLSYWSSTSIERLYTAGVTGGCSASPLNYCPTTPVTRAQMAIFLLRGMHGSTYTPPAATGTVFNDVPLGTFGAAWIEQLAAEGITSGCGGSNYCPNTTVSRAQMAIFLVRAKHGVAFVPPTATGIFGDVPIGSFGANFIEQLVTDAITSGCGSGNFCPNTMVKRDSMAVFLVKTFNLP